MTVKSEPGVPQSSPGTVACIIPPAEHPIDNGQIDTDALYILETLSGAGFSGYLVGGGVRDLYLGKVPKDFDISTDARPGQLRKLFPNSNTIGRRFRLVQVFFKGGKTIEISTLRSLSEHDLDGPETVLAPNNTFGTLSEDACRRDLTINSLFYEIENGTIIDYVGGIRDLDKAIIRIVGDPQKRIGRDPVRMLRAIRHASRNGFSIEEKTWNAICANNKKLSLCPPSRLRDEFLKDLYSGASAPWFKLAHSSEIYYSLFPLYRRILTRKSKSQLDPGVTLQNIFVTIDRVNNECVTNHIHRQPDYFLIGLMLVPWAESRFQLYSTARKGAQLFQLAKLVREEIDKTIGVELNLRRSLRQEMVALLINLAQLLNNKQKNNWPKWLKKKSYFKKAKLFYHFYIEATTGLPVDLDLLSPLPKQSRRKDLKTPTTSNSSPKYKPALAVNTAGGIFGFKK